MIHGVYSVMNSLLLLTIHSLTKDVMKCSRCYPLSVGGSNANIIHGQHKLLRHHWLWRIIQSATSTVHQSPMSCL